MALHCCVVSLTALHHEQALSFVVHSITYEPQIMPRFSKLKSYLAT